MTIRYRDAEGTIRGAQARVLDFDNVCAKDWLAVKVLGDETPRTITGELVATVRNKVTIDRILRENVRAQLRVRVKRILLYHRPRYVHRKANRPLLFNV